jgi:hypothetical protein
MSFYLNKTEITKIPESNFTINGRTVPITNSYNLGVTFAVILNGIYILKIVIKYLQTPACSSKVKI